MAHKKRKAQKFNCAKVKIAEPERVELPELAEAWEGDGEPFVLVHPMTVRDKTILGSYVNQLGLSEISSEAIIAALTARGEDGNLAFGASRAEAVETVSALPEYLRPAVQRIATKSLELTGKMGDAGVSAAKKK